MTLSLWYRDLDKDLIADKLLGRLRSCGFSVLEGAEDCWKIVRLRRNKLFWDVSGRIEGHVCATAYRLGTKPHLLPYFLHFLRLSIRDRDLPVREAILEIGPSFEFPFFTIAAHRNERPPLLVEEFADGECEETAPGEPSYWERNGPKLHFVAAEVLAEPGVADPTEWAAALGTALHSDERGQVFDCGWNEWCQTQAPEMCWPGCGSKAV